MKNNKIILCCLAAFFALAGTATPGKAKTPVCKDAGKPVEERMEDLLSRMTTEEKVWQQIQYPVGIAD